jgi:GNAT superfamily N-acetyltransferase
MSPSSTAKSGRLSLGALANSHDRTLFDCGRVELNEYLRRFARQNADAGVAKTFVASPLDAPSQIVGFYSLAATSVTFSSLPSAMARRLPRYPVPAALLARLAIDRAHQGQGHGAILLADAYQRVLLAADHIGIHLLVIHAKDEAARRFYQRFNAVPLVDEPLHLVVDVRVIRAAVAASGLR